jgi:hypothetical protein
MAHRSAAHFALHLVLVALVALPFASCRPELDAPPGGAGGGGGGGGGDVTFSLEPDATPERAPLALRVRIAGGCDPDRVRFVAGEVGPGHLRQLADDDPSNALEERLLPATVWQDGDDVVVAPHARLVPGEEYAVAVPDRGVALELVATEEAEGGIALRRVWPPVDTPVVSPRLVLCGDVELPAFDREIALAPAGVTATLRRGATTTGAGRRCARIETAGAVPHDVPLLPPPSVEVDGAVVLHLDPAPLQIVATVPADMGSLGCDASEVPLGPGCARVLDDRAFLRTPAEPLLWAFSGEGLDLVALGDPGAPLTVHPLAPGASQVVDVAVVDAAGREVAVVAALVTRAPMPHVVLNEVLSDPVGPDTTGEWIELFNDGDVAASLLGLQIVDVGGVVDLPAAVLQPGAFAVVVDEGWAPDPALDVVPPEGTLILRVPQLGRSGLANAGELLRLVDAGGTVLSAVPATPSPGAGTSTARREPWLADTPSSFAPGVATPGSTNQLLSP